MVLEMTVRPEAVTRVERFLVTDSYRQLAESTMSFNRRLNEERRMRIPYIDGQTGVAQKHYNSERKARERMPGRFDGQIYSYPQKRWRKRKYQYLQYFMQPKQLRLEAEAEALASLAMDNPVNLSEEAGAKPDNDKGEEWGGLYEDDLALQEPDEEPQESDSDFEFDGTRIKKTKSKKLAKAKAVKQSVPSTKPLVPKPPQPNKRRTHADNIPDSEKPFTCDLCCARYKTRPGLTYHYNHTHKGRLDADPYTCFQEDEEARSTDSPSAGSDSQEGSVRGKEGYATPFQEEDSQQKPPKPPHNKSDKGGKSKKASNPPAVVVVAPPAPLITNTKAAAGEPAPYCDFCLGDSQLNKKSGQPEDLIACAECGRSGHPTCLQFTGNMMVSVRQYPWQCIECKTCTLCGTSENDDQLLFCDDCDRGFHMYCLVPPMKVAPEGSWSCHICTETFHKHK